MLQDFRDRKAFSKLDLVSVFVCHLIFLQILFSSRLLIIDAVIVINQLRGIF